MRVQVWGSVGVAHAHRGEGGPFCMGGPVCNPASLVPGLSERTANSGASPLSGFSLVSEGLINGDLLDQKKHKYEGLELANYHMGVRGSQYRHK